MYCAIIGDLIDSKKIEPVERKQLQEKLRLLLGRVNNDYKDYIAANFLITLGDEFQGLLSATYPAIEIIELIIREIFPHKVRFGVGIGEIYTQINNQVALGADGPAFHLAREAINELKDVRQEKLNYFPVRFKTQNNDASILNALCVSISLLMSGWTDKQCELVFKASQFKGQQKYIAEELGISTPTVSRGLKAANYEQYKLMFDETKDYLRNQYDTAKKEEKKDEGKLKLEKAKGFNNEGLYLLEKFKFDEAIAKFKEALENKDGNDSNTVRAYFYTAEAYRNKGESEEALLYYQKGLNLKTSSEDVINFETGAIYNGMGIAYGQTGKYVKSIQCLNKALKIGIALFGNEHSNVAATYDNIGNVFEEQGKYDKSLKYFNDALTIREKVLGNEHADVATSYNNIGITYFDKGNYEKAREYFDKALAIYEKILGKMHPETATSYNNIGNIYKALDEYENAREYYNKALAIYEKVLGKNHPNTKKLYRNLAELYDKIGNTEKSLEFVKKAENNNDKVK